MLHALLKLQTRGELFPEPTRAEISFYPLGADCIFSAVINWINILYSIGSSVGELPAYNCLAICRQICFRFSLELFSLTSIG